MVKVRDFTVNIKISPELEEQIREIVRDEITNIFSNLEKSFQTSVSLGYGERGHSEFTCVTSTNPKFPEGASHDNQK